MLHHLLVSTSGACHGKFKLRLEFSVKQADIDRFRLMKNGYIQEEIELLKKHVAEQLVIIKAHEQRICEVCKQGEGVWLSDFWLKV